MTKKLTYLLACVALLFSLFASETDANTSLTDIRELVEKNYVGKIKGNLEDAQSINELMNMLDAYSEYYTAEEYQRLIQTINQSMVGIGISYQQISNGLLIVSTYEDGSAFEAGIQVGDIIKAINGVTVQNLSTEKITSMMVGSEGSTVELTLETETGSTVVKTITRKSFTIPIVTTAILYGNVGYIHLSSFGTTTAFDVKRKASEMVNQGVNTFIIDLQDNGGGYVETARQLISLFPNSVNAFVEKTFNQTKMISPLYMNYKLPNTPRVLINRYSASASEMVAASLKDQNGAIVYGERSYGKGTIQSFMRINGGDVLKLTTNEFLGPNHTKINEVGVNPDVLTETPIQQAHLDSITEKYPTYKLLKTFENVDRTKIFTLKFNQEISSNIASESIELIQLGNQQVPISIKINHNELIITPNNPLLPGQQYALFIHPTNIKNTHNKALKNGYYVPITVKK
jgi:carboxyl-terminal processing protease